MWKMSLLRPIWYGWIETSENKKRTNWGLGYTKLCLSWAFLRLCLTGNFSLCFIKKQLTADNLRNIFILIFPNDHINMKIKIHIVSTSIMDTIKVPRFTVEFLSLQVIIVVVPLPPPPLSKCSVRAEVSAHFLCNPIFRSQSISCTQ